MSERSFDQARAEHFAGRMMDILNNASLALMSSIGHQVGLFDTMATLPPSTSREIAAAAGLQERYTREWLGAMVTGRIVEYEPAAEAYVLPPEHAAWVTREAGMNNLALVTQYISMMANAEERIINAFRAGGGVPYAAYPRMQQIMAEDTRGVHDAMLVDAILPLVPGLVERLRTGIDVLDVGCGSGHTVNLIARAFPRSRVCGYDLSEEGVAMGREEAERLELANARFEVRDATMLVGSERYDLITAFFAIHDLAQPAKALQGIKRALRPGGIFLMVEAQGSSNVAENLDNPVAPFLYAISSMHCVAVSMHEDGPALGAMWGQQKARQMLADAGFSRVDVTNIAGDLFNNYYIAAKE